MHFLAWSTDSYVLFKEWTTSSVYLLVLAMVSSCVVGGLYEWLRNTMSAWDRRVHVASTKYQVLALRLFRSGLHSLLAFTSYAIMLFLMTYNLWVVLSILIGCGVGFFLVGLWMLPHREESEKIQHMNRNLESKHSQGNVSGCKDSSESAKLMTETVKLSPEKSSSAPRDNVKSHQRRDITTQKCCPESATLLKNGDSPAQ